MILKLLLQLVGLQIDTLFLPNYCNLVYDWLFESRLEKDLALTRAKLSKISLTNNYYHLFEKIFKKIVAKCNFLPCLNVYKDMRPADSIR